MDQIGQISRHAVDRQTLRGWENENDQEKRDPGGNKSAEDPFWLFAAGLDIRRDMAEHSS